MKNKVLALMIVLCFFSMSIFATGLEPTSVMELNDSSAAKILANGDATVVEDISLTATAFANFKQQYPQLSMFARFFDQKTMPIQIEDLDVQVDEFNNKIVAKYTVKGMAVNNGNNLWGIAIAVEGQKIVLSAQTETAVVFSYADQTSGYNKMITTTYNLPAGVTQIVFNKESNILSYVLEIPEDTSFGNWVFLALGILLLGGAVINQKLKY